jgi:hypothetical protein
MLPPIIQAPEREPATLVEGEADPPLTEVRATTAIEPTSVSAQTAIVTPYPVLADLMRPRPR